MKSAYEIAVVAVEFIVQFIKESTWWGVNKVSFYISQLFY